MKQKSECGKFLKTKHTRKQYFGRWREKGANSEWQKCWHKCL